MQASDIVRAGFMNTIYTLVPLKGVPLEYFMDHLGS
jgi:hypothetical protein